MAQYFKIEEFFRTNTGLDNFPPQGQTHDVVLNLEALTDKILDPARKRFGAPIMVTSGYRSPEVNKAVGGSPRSQHMKGEAVDLVCKDNKILFSILKELGGFDQLIWEHGGKWIHVSYKRNGKNRGEVLCI